MLDQMPTVVYRNSGNVNWEPEFGLLEVGLAHLLFASMYGRDKRKDISPTSLVFLGLEPIEI